MNSQIVHFHPYVVKRLAITSTGTLTFYFKRTLKDKIPRIIVLNSKQPTVQKSS